MHFKPAKQVSCFMHHVLNITVPLFLFTNCLCLTSHYRMWMTVTAQEGKVNHSAVALCHEYIVEDLSCCSEVSMLVLHQYTSIMCQTTCKSRMQSSMLSTHLYIVACVMCFPNLGHVMLPCSIAVSLKSASFLRICTHNLWKDKWQIPLGTSHELFCINLITNLLPIKLSSTKWKITVGFQKAIENHEPIAATNTCTH